MSKLSFTSTNRSIGSDQYEINMFLRGSYCLHSVNPVQYLVTASKAAFMYVEVVEVQLEMLLHLGTSEHS